MSASYIHFFEQCPYIDEVAYVEVAGADLSYHVLTWEEGAIMYWKTRKSEAKVLTFAEFFFKISKFFVHKNG